MTKRILIGSFIGAIIVLLGAYIGGYDFQYRGGDALAVYIITLMGAGFGALAGLGA